MKLVDQLPTAARGEVSVVLGGQPRTFKFSTNVLRDYSQLTGRLADNIAHDIANNFTETLPTLTYCAIRRFVPAEALPEGFDLDTLVDWLDELSDADANLLADALLGSIKAGNPLVATTMKKLLELGKEKQQLLAAETKPSKA